MNTKQAQYAIELAKTKNFSQVSEKLNISQPTLSKQIINLENSLGVKLFERSTASVSVTPAGEHFVREAQQLLFQEEQLLRSLEQYSNEEKGRLTIGISPFRNLFLMPQIVNGVKEAFPGIHVILHETNSDQLRKEAAEGKYDFAIVNLPVDESQLDVICLEEELLVLAVPNTMVDRLPVSEDADQIDFADCKDLPFVVMAKSQEMRRYFDSLCANCNVMPEISLEVAGGIITAWSMACAGMGATLLPLSFFGNRQFDSSLTLYKLKGMNYTRQPAVVTRRGQYLSKAARFAIGLLQETEMSKESNGFR